MLAKRDLTLSKFVVVLVVLWIVGVATSHTFGGFIHLLLVVTAIAVLLRIIQGRDPARTP